MKIYKFIGKGDGVLGLPHELSKDLGDTYIKNYEKLLEDIDKAEKQAIKDKKPFRRPYLDGQPGKILLDCLAKDIYRLDDDEKKLSAKKPGSKISGTKEDPEPETVDDPENEVQPKNQKGDK